jgi:hypothetical protein
MPVIKVIFVFDEPESSEIKVLFIYEKRKFKLKEKRNPSAYNMLLGEYMRQIALKERISRGDCMKKAQEMYREWKTKQQLSLFDTQ